MGSPHPAGTILAVTLEGDADRRPLRAVYLGVVDGGVDRPDRRMYAVDDGDPTMGWALLMEPQIGTVDLVPPPITMIVVKDTAASHADIEELASLIRDANQDTGGFLIVPKDVMEQVDLVQVQDTPDTPDAVAALRKVLKGQDGDLTPAEVALCARLRSP